MDDDLDRMSRQELIDEVKKLRNGVASCRTLRARRHSIKARGSDRDRRVTVAAMFRGAMERRP